MPLPWIYSLNGTRAPKYFEEFHGRTKWECKPDITVVLYPLVRSLPIPNTRHGSQT